MEKRASLQVALGRRASLLTVWWVGYWLFLTWLLLEPKPPRPPLPFTISDLIAHFATFVILAFSCAAVRWAKAKPFSCRWVVFWLLVFSAYGAITEIIQPLTGRSADPIDWLADSVGIAFVLIPALLLHWRRRSMPQEAEQV